MKIKNVALSLAGLTAVTLGLGQVGVLEAKNVGMDLTNAVQHIVNVKLIGGGGSTLKNAGNRLVGIDTDNFVISKDETSNRISGASLSNILGGQGNQINKGEASTILGGQDNTIGLKSNMNNTILGGSGNKIGESGESNYSTIVGGVTNKVDGDNSVVIGGINNRVNGNNSVVLGTDSSVDGNFSAALGKNSTNNADNSFLWTDATHNDALPNTISNVFVVNSERGMVVNANQPNPLAQLTIGGSLVINGNDVDVLNTCNATYKGVLKVVKGDNDHTCFCSCDGNGYWHSLYGQGRCEGKCNESEHEPDCFESGKQARYNVCSDRYVGSCNEYSKPVTGEGAYFVGSDGKVHWTCQTDAGKTRACNSSTKDTTLSCS